MYGLRLSSCCSCRYGQVEMHALCEHEERTRLHYHKAIENKGWFTTVC